jgi:hypothetical protein
MRASRPRGAAPAARVFVLTWPAALTHNKTHNTINSLVVREDRDPATRGRDMRIREDARVFPMT